MICRFPWLLLLLCAWLVPAWSSNSPSVREVLDEARELSFGVHWQEVQDLLDGIAYRVDPSELRDYADFHLMQARHLSLADRSTEALARIEDLLLLDLDDDQRLRALQFSANLSVLLREYERAFEYLREALAIPVGPEDMELRIATLNMASYMLGRVGEYESGLAHGQEALALARQMGSGAQTCVSLQRLAPVYKWAGRPRQSEQAYREGIEECTALGNSLFIGVLQHGLADLLRGENRPEEALPLAEAAIEALIEAVYPLGEYEARLVRAETLHQLGALADVHSADLARLATYFGERELWDQQARLELLESGMAEASGELDRALLHLRRHIQARESFLGRERAMRLAYLQVAFESRLQEQEIDLLRETARVAQLEAQTATQQRSIRTFGWLFIILVFLLLLSLLVRTLRSRRQFRELSRQDRLSGLANHSWFFERAELMIQAYLDGSVSGRPVLVIADIDHFKRINDGFGHQMGDQILGGVARRLRESFPEPALVGRIGGEEFAVLLHADDLDQVLSRIERFRHPEPGSLRAGDPEVSLSFGLSCFQSGDGMQALRKRADLAMYQAKADGRDCIRLDASCRLCQPD